MSSTDAHRCRFCELEERHPLPRVCECETNAHAHPECMKMEIRINSDESKRVHEALQCNVCKKDMIEVAKESNYHAMRSAVSFQMMVHESGWKTPHRQSSETYTSCLSLYTLPLIFYSTYLTKNSRSYKGKFENDFEDVLDPKDCPERQPKIHHKLEAGLARTPTRNKDRDRGVVVGLAIGLAVTLVLLITTLVLMGVVVTDPEQDPETLISWDDHYKIPEKIEEQAPKRAEQTEGTNLLYSTLLSHAKASRES